MAPADVRVRPAASSWSVSDAQSLCEGQRSRNVRRQTSRTCQRAPRHSRAASLVRASQVNGFTPMKWLKFKPTYHIPQHLNQELGPSGLLQL